MLKLGTTIKDSASGLPGSLTHMNVDTGGNVLYLFQPRGLNPKTGAPLETYWISGDRVCFAETIGNPDFPQGILGSKAEDKASGFAGTVVSLTVHINGCVHAILQAAGRQPESLDMIKSVDFDIRRLQGSAIPNLSESERKADEKKKPGPAPCPPMPRR